MEDVRRKLVEIRLELYAVGPALWFCLGDWNLMRCGWRSQDRSWKAQGVISPLFTTIVMTGSLLKMLWVQHGSRAKRRWEGGRSGQWEVTTQKFLKAAPQQPDHWSRVSWGPLGPWEQDGDLEGQRCSVIVQRACSWIAGPSVQVALPYSLRHCRYHGQQLQRLTLYSVHGYTQAPPAQKGPREKERRARKNPNVTQYLHNNIVSSKGIN